MGKNDARERQGEYFLTLTDLSTNTTRHFGSLG